MRFSDLTDEETENLLGKINLPQDTKLEMVESLKILSSMEDGPYEISYDDITVDELRKRITTLNNLIVRLPTKTAD